MAIAYLTKAPLNRTQAHRACCTSIHIFSTDPHQHLLKRRIIHQQPVLPRTRPCAYLSRREPKGRVRTLYASARMLDEHAGGATIRDVQPYARQTGGEERVV